MKLGAVLPQAEIGTAPEQVARYVRAIEALGCDSLLAYDHVVGVRNSASMIGKFSGYTIDHPFLEPLALFAFAAGITTELRFMSGIVILPQRQTVLAAKQAATVDVLAGGRLSLGFGVGYERAEFDALGMPFTRRGERLERQIAIMRDLWANETVTLDQPDVRIADGGINPRPVRGRIPVVVGAMREAGLDRAARIGDGWLSPHLDGPAIAGAVRDMEARLTRLGRDRADYMIAGLILCREFTGGSVATLTGEAAAVARCWRDVGADLAGLDTTFCGLRSIEEHLELTERVLQAMG